MTHDSLCPAQICCGGMDCDHCGSCQCELIEAVIKRTISTTNKTWGHVAMRAKNELLIVRAQRDLLAERSGLPMPAVIEGNEGYV